MKYLVLVFILFTYGSTDKENTNQEFATRDMLIVFEDSEELQTKTKPLIASYDNDLDLILLEENLESWYEAYLEVQSGESKYIDFYANQYRGLYWLSNQNQYYYVTDPIETNNITYTLDTNKQFEKIYQPRAESQQEYFYAYRNTPSLYVGSISPLERIYLNSSNNQLFLKKLTLIDDSTAYPTFEERDKTDDNTPRPLIYPVYPTKPKEHSYNLLFTNILGETFYRIHEPDTNMRGKLIQYIITE